MQPLRPAVPTPALEPLETRNLFSAAAASVLPAEPDARPVIDAAERSNTSDFNNDGDNDLVFRNRALGTIGALLLDDDGDEVEGSVALPRLANANWDLAGVADFSGDGRPDLLFRNLANNRNVVWIMDGTRIASTVTLPRAPAPWRVVGVGDFNRDGTADIFWQHANRRSVTWVINAGSVASTSGGPRIPAGGWAATGVGDFDDDGDSDILLRRANGQNAIWHFNNLSFNGRSTRLPPLRDLNWQVGEVKDLDDDDGADIAWRNTASHQTMIWFLDDDDDDSDDRLEVEEVSFIPGTSNRNWELPLQPNAQFLPSGTLAALARGDDIGDDDGDDESAPADALVDVEPLVSFGAV